MQAGLGVTRLRTAALSCAGQAPPDGDGRVLVTEKGAVRRMEQLPRQREHSRVIGGNAKDAALLRSIQEAIKKLGRLAFAFQGGLKQSRAPDRQPVADRSGPVVIRLSSIGCAVVLQIPAEFLEIFLFQRIDESGRLAVVWLLAKQGNGDMGGVRKGKAQFKGHGVSFWCCGDGWDGVGERRAVPLRDQSSSQMGMHLPG